MDDFEICWRTVYGEAEPGDEADALAIAWVIRNRMRLPNWPSTPGGVCLQPWQFSCWNPGNPRLPHIRSVDPAVSPWARTCKRIATFVLDGTGPADPTRRSTHYYATWAKRPAWAKWKTPVHETPAGTYNHLFFNDIDTPPPADAAAALEQARPLAATRTVKAGQVAAGATVAGVAVGPLLDLVQQVAPALPYLQRLAELAPWGLALLALAGIGWMLWARLDDRRRGLR